MGTIESAIGLHHCRNQGFDSGRLRDINLYEGCIPAVFCNHMDSPLTTVFVHIGDNQFGTFSGKGECRGSADA